MLTSEQLKVLFEYNLWADRRTLDACAALTNEQFTRELGSSFTSVRDTLAHLYGAEWLWNERIQGRLPAGLPPASTFPDLAGVRAKLEEMDHYYIDFVSKLAHAGFRARRALQNAKWQRVFKSAVANLAPTYQPCHLSPGSSSHDVAATGSKGGHDRLDQVLLSRTGRQRHRLTLPIPRTTWKRFTPSNG